MLLELQRRFFAALDDPDAAPPRFAGPLAESGFAAYRNNWRAGTRKVLASDYPVVARLVGDECLSALATAYRRACPSRSGNLEHFGARFPAFLAAQYGTSSYAFLPDVARLERAMDECLLAGPAPVATLEALSTIAPVDLEGVRLRVHPALRLVRSAWPILAIWEAHQGTEDPRTVDLALGGTDLLVQRDGGQVLLRPIDSDAFDLLLALENDLPLGSALAQTFDESKSSSASTALAQLFAWGCITRVMQAPSSTLSIGAST